MLFGYLRLIKLSILQDSVRFREERPSACAKWLCCFHLQASVVIRMKAVSYRNEIQKPELIYIFADKA